jgi:hypothetical protein
MKQLSALLSLYIVFLSLPAHASSSMTCFHAALVVKNRTKNLVVHVDEGLLMKSSDRLAPNDTLKACKSLGINNLSIEVVDLAGNTFSQAPCPRTSYSDGLYIIKITQSADDIAQCDTSREQQRATQKPYNPPSSDSIYLMMMMMFLWD